MKKKLSQLSRKNIKLSKAKWIGKLDKQNLEALRSLTETYEFTIALGDPKMEQFDNVERHGLG